MSELLTLVDVFEKVAYSITSDSDSNKKEIVKWVLVKGWEQKRMYIALDGLSLDRHWSFTRILSEVHFSFSKSYEQ